MTLDASRQPAAALTHGLSSDPHCAVALTHCTARLGLAGTAARARALLRAGANPNVPDAEGGWTAVHHCVAPADLNLAGEYALQPVAAVAAARGCMPDAVVDAMPPACACSRFAGQPRDRRASSASGSCSTPAATPTGRTTTVAPPSTGQPGAACTYACRPAPPGPLPAAAGACRPPGCAGCSLVTSTAAPCDGEGGYDGGAVASPHGLCLHATAPLSRVVAANRPNLPDTTHRVPGSAACA